MSGWRRPDRSNAATADSWSNRLLLEVAEADPKGTRWGRGSIALVTSLVVAAGVGLLIEQGVLAASFNLTNQKFTLRSNQLNSKGLGVYLNNANTYDATKTAFRGATPAARVAVPNATLDGFCGIVTQSIGGFNVYLRLTAGATVTGTPSGDAGVINASNLYLEATDLLGSQINSTGSATADDPAHTAQVQNAYLGISADTVKLPQVDASGNPAPAILMPQSPLAGTAATPGTFGLQGAGGVDANGNLLPGTFYIPGLVVNALDAEITGSLNLPKLKVNVTGGTSGATNPGC